ncbi:hypothetical protein [Pseudobacteriovorax antillogorgiicola]|uniref:Uncharacterized protein n=1 Tax=Pseudobacteriovorax antillogorgiicola TaxID=1513793 RepID=A0A1Y6C7S2_9BACT|nr:hypothetical protein [Pseudobacteriovorax antillogorgiicola]TCS49362.1 hypothetical protein EDD56_11542 [Pseudobacteriovorax antillogorgiicola]SMF47519.1 hypothetical protein SAMN06296036_114142 [Pseudobacteriovorax antillogorgiicola]
MLQFIKRLFTSDQSNPGQNPDFIRLVQMTRDDPSFRATIEQVVNLPSTNRNVFLDQRIATLRAKSAPAEHIHIFACLKDDKICEQLRAISLNQD